MSRVSPPWTEGRGVTQQHVGIQHAHTNSHTDMNVLIEYVPVITSWQKITLTHNKCTITPGTIIPAGKKEKKKTVSLILCPAERKRKNSVITPWSPAVSKQKPMETEFMFANKAISAHASHTLFVWLFFLNYRGQATEWGAVNLTEVQKNTPSRHPKLAIVLRYSSRLYVIIAWQHTKIKQVALVHIVTRLHLEFGCVSLPKEGLVFGTHRNIIYIYLYILF